MRLADWMRKNGFKPREIPKFPTDRNDGGKEKAMAEEEKKVETPVPEVPLEQKKEMALEKRYNECLKTEQLPFELIGEKVRVWTCQHPNGYIEGRVKCVASMYMIVKEQQGLEKYIWYSSGPVLAKLEF